VVEAGRIVERGTHESLYAAGGRYWELYTKQQGLEQNLFLAPGEGAAAAEEAADILRETQAITAGDSEPGLPGPVRLLRDRDN
jgi:hypothetical protein